MTTLCTISLVISTVSTTLYVNYYEISMILYLKRAIETTVQRDRYRCVYKTFLGASYGFRNVEVRHSECTSHERSLKQLFWYGFTRSNYYRCYTKRFVWNVVGGS